MNPVSSINPAPHEAFSAPKRSLLATLFCCCLRQKIQPVPARVDVQDKALPLIKTSLTQRVEAAAAGVLMMSDLRSSSDSSGSYAPPAFSCFLQTDPSRDTSPLELDGEPTASPAQDPRSDHGSPIDFLDHLPRIERLAILFSMSTLKHRIEGDTAEEKAAVVEYIIKKGDLKGIYALHALLKTEEYKKIFNSLSEETTKILASLPREKTSMDMFRASAKK